MKNLLKTIATFPLSPGVYLMKDKQGKVIYIGKAKELKKRVKSYFIDKQNSRPLIRFLLNKIADIEPIVTNNEKEALLLENNLIKKHKPKYNIELKDDKNYLSIMINLQEHFPRITLLRVKKKQTGSIYFGPFSSVRQVKKTVNQLYKIFPLRQCSLPNFKSRSRPCLNFQIKKCLGPCSNDIPSKEYREIVDQVILFLQGKGEKLISQLKHKMLKASQELNFEKAARIRDKIKAIKITLEKQSVALLKEYNQDIIVFSESRDKWYFQVMIVRKGKVLDTFSYIWSHKIYEQQEILTSFISQYYLNETKEIPEEIIIPCLVPYKKQLTELLSSKAEKKVSLIVPKTGHKYNLLTLAQKNLENFISRKRKENNDALLELKQKLQLPQTPHIIECFDISNIQGANAVGGVVAFKDGAFLKERFRRYKVKTVSQISDYAMMSEILFRHCENMRKEEYKPDLIVIDGGKGHLNIALEVLKKLKINNLTAMSIAKEKNAKASYEKIYIPHRKNPLIFRKNSPALLLLKKIRDEVHRFAITYHKTLRKKNTIKSILDEIPGIGSKKKKSLLEKFKSVEEIKKAEVKDIRQVKGIDYALAKKILDFLNQTTA